MPLATRRPTAPFLVVCGHTNLDLHLLVNELPRAGQSTPVVERRTNWGGTAATIARHAGGLGVPVRLWSRVGEDFPASWRQALVDDGVDLSSLVTVAGAQTPTCLVLTDRERRQAYCMDQGSMASMAADPPTEEVLEGMTKGSWLHLATGDPGAYANLAAVARQKGLRIALDPGQEMRFRYDAPNLVRLLERSDVVFLNEDELRISLALLDGFEAEDLLPYAPNLVVTRGERGASLYRDGHKVVHQPAFPAEVVDPTGAGDALRAGFYAALHAGKPMAVALRWGQAAAAVNMGRPGAQETSIRRADLAAIGA